MTNMSSNQIHVAAVALSVSSVLFTHSVSSVSSSATSLLLLLFILDFFLFLVLVVCVANAVVRRGV